MELVQGSSNELESYFKTRESYMSAGITTFDTMWSLFVPGKHVYAKPFLNTPQLFVVEAPPFNWEKPETPHRLSADCWCYDWNGKYLVKAFFEIHIERFRGTKPINELPCYPLEYYGTDDGRFQDQAELRKMLIERGTKFYKTVKVPKGASQMKNHEGPALSERQGGVGARTESARSSNFIDFVLATRGKFPSRDNREDQRTAVTAKGKYIVDSDAFLTYASRDLALGQMNPYNVDEKGGADRSGHSTVNLVKAGEQDLPEDDVLMLLPPRLLGYSTQSKFWGQFRVDGTSDVGKPDSDAFDNKLQLDKNYKEMIQALVKSHEGEKSPNRNKVQIKDIAVDKGKGLVILLHGPPGVGKTVSIFLANVETRNEFKDILPKTA